MSRSTRTVSALIALVLVGGLALTACGSSTSTSTTTTAAPATTEANNKNFSVSTADGQVSISLNGQLPPNWPKAFPLPNGATTAGSGSLGGTDSTAMVGVFSATGTPEDTFAFYKDNTSLTVSDSKVIGAGSAYVGTLQLSGSYTGRVTVLSKDGTTYILVALQAAGTGTTTGTGGSSGTGA